MLSPPQAAVAVAKHLPFECDPTPGTVTELPNALLPPPAYPGNSVAVPTLGPLLSPCPRRRRPWPFLVTLSPAQPAVAVAKGLPSECDPTPR